MKSSIDIQCFKADKKRQEYSDAASSNRRLNDRRQLHYDRRDALILRGQARYDRRRNDRRDLTVLRQPSPYLRTELVSARSAPVASVAGYNVNLLHMWVITEQADLNGQLRNYSDRLLYIRINQRCITEIPAMDCELGEAYPDVVLIDMRLPIDTVIEHLRVIRKRMASVKIILLYEQNFPDLINEIIEYRISGFLQIGIDYKIFEKAIQVVVHRGELWFPHRLIRQIFDTLISWQNPSCAFQPRDVVLTKSEQEIIKLVSKGLTNKQIAQQLTVSPETVKKHLKSVFIKTGVRNRSQLVFGYFSGINDFK